MHDDSIRREIRKTEAEAALLAIKAAGGELPHSGIIEAVGGDASTGSHAAATLRRLGLASEEQSIAHETTLTPQGLRVADSLLNSRHNGPERWDAVERAIADSLINRGMGWHLGELDGIPVSDNETRLAVHNLERWGLVRAERNAGNEIYVVMPLDPIHQVPGLDGLLKEHFEGRASSNDYSSTTNIGNGNTIAGVQTGGESNTQTVTQSVTVNQRAQVLGMVGGLLRTLDDAEGDTQDLRVAVEAIRDVAASDGATRDSLKDRVMQALVVAGATESGQLIAQGLAQLLGVVIN